MTPVIITCPEISIHAPLAGSDYIIRGHIAMANEFQSTLPLRGATATYCIVKVLDVKICRTASRIGGIPTS